MVAMGPYTALVDNGPARKAGFSRAMFETGEAVGDQFELSSLRREDYELAWDRSKEFVDVLQCNNAASSRTPRGHQLPVAFMSLVNISNYKGFILTGKVKFLKNNLAEWHIFGRCIKIAFLGTHTNEK